MFQLDIQICSQYSLRCDSVALIWCAKTRIEFNIHKHKTYSHTYISLWLYSIWKCDFIKRNACVRTYTYIQLHRRYRNQTVRSHTNHIKWKKGIWVPTTTTTTKLKLNMRWMKTYATYRHRSLSVALLVTQ